MKKPKSISAAETYQIWSLLMGWPHSTALAILGREELYWTLILPQTSTFTTTASSSIPLLTIRRSNQLTKQVNDKSLLNGAHCQSSSSEEEKIRLPKAGTRLFFCHPTTVKPILIKAAVLLKPKACVVCRRAGKSLHKAHEERNYRMVKCRQRLVAFRL